MVNPRKRNSDCLYEIKLALRSRKATGRVGGIITLDIRIYSPPRRLYGLES